MLLSGCSGEINPAELEAFHLARPVIDAGYSASAAVWVLILQGLMVGIPLPRKTSLHVGLLRFLRYAKQTRCRSADAEWNGLFIRPL